ncbi:MAG: DUF262 domain-containing protein, partial [Erysipelotrichaceae bacterium]
ELLRTFENRETIPFLGSIILKQAECRTSFSAEAIIIDGQQRLTTISILAKVIYDCLPADKKTADSGIRRDIENFLFYRDNSSDDFPASHVKIEHSRLDSKDYNHVIKSGLLDDEKLIDCETIPDNASKILQCYKYFYNLLILKTPEDLKKLHDSLFNSERHTIVLIELLSDDNNEQRIFDTINRAGEKLSSADIIKNNLFKQCLNVCEIAHKNRDDVCELHDSLWEATFYKDEGVSKIWDTKRVFGNVQKSNLEFLLYCVAEIKWGKNDDLFSKMEKVYSEKTADYDYENMEDLIHEISEYGAMYKKYILDFHEKYTNEDEPLVFGYKDVANRLLLILDVFGVQMFYPYVLKRIRDVNENLKDDSLCHDFAVLESFIVRRRLSGKGVTDYAIKCDQILHPEEGENDIIGVLAKEMSNADGSISDDTISNYFNKVNNDTAKPILFTFELFKRSQPKHDNQKIQYGYTLEHIIPKKWTQNWKDVDIYDMATGELFEGTDDDKIKYRNSAVLNLGNMILLNLPLNSAVSNNTIKIKVNGIEEKNHIGYRTCSSMELTREIVSDYDNGNEVWDERQIVKRKKSLLELFFKIWPSFADEVIVKKNSDEMVEEIQKEEENVVSQEALADPIVMLQEMGASKENPFLTQIKNTPMQYSYKPVFIKAIFEYADENGVSDIDDVVEYFIKFYSTIKTEHGYVEKEDSVFAKSEISIKGARKTIVTYPCAIFEEDGVIVFDKQDGTIQIIEDIWKSLSKKDVADLHKICDDKIKNYFENLQS